MLRVQSSDLGVRVLGPWCGGLGNQSLGLRVGVGGRFRV